MIEKMKFLSITGPKEDIDRLSEAYLSKYEIHLENALSELKTVTDLRPFTETNPYKEVYQLADELTDEFKERLPSAGPGQMTLEQAADVVHTLNNQLDKLRAERADCCERLDMLHELLDKIFPFLQLDYDLSEILKFRYIKFRFGRISHEYYNKFMQYVYDTIDTVLHKCSEDKDYVWIVYFAPDTLVGKIDAIYASMHFERYYLPDEYHGTPSDAISNLQIAISGLQDKISQIDARMRELTTQQKDDLIAACQRLETYATNFNIRKLAACTTKGEHCFYILCGWMTDRDTERFRKELNSDDKVFMIIEDDRSGVFSSPPTKLKNPRIFKPFELFIKMYGLPTYGETDPTILLGLTYSFLFGFMFGDVGQGLCLFLGGLLLYTMKKVNLAAIISCCGIFSAIFGFMFGSVFGFENIIEPLWLHPKSAITSLPSIGNLNTVFVVAVGMGMGIIILSMIINIVNSIRNHDAEKAYFDTNSITGLVFYSAAVITIVLFLTGYTFHAAIFLVIMFLIPLLIIFLKEPLAALVQKKAEVMPHAKGMFVVQGVFELFEVLLSYFSNTLSFVRVGAFAISHAAMMEVVLMLAGAEAGTPNWLVIILGNLFVCGMEGLIVGIQVLRLEYYELFSRFYSGSGRAFKPFGKDN